ncbi:hypothetical protein [Halostreptopolyspora alba]|uniref:Ig-like domain-containing protein n=1 Tax=Halostreptopolyspora alba TaxID=2487137 RepID=A0A3N0EIB4_9ACTN|nr:hypothetical protein EFW17_02145 [Nocardiopsaceae bacterium YIM 96095]
MVSALPLLGLLLVACAPDGAVSAEPRNDAAGQEREVPEGPDNVTCVGSEEELLAPLDEAEGSTDWSSEEWPPAGAPPDLPPEEEAFPSPEEFMAAVADSYAGAAENEQREGDQRFEVRLLCAPTGEETQGAVLEWGFLDDSVAGADVRLTLVQEAEGWQVAETERRSHCRRGQSGEMCL